MPVDLCTTRMIIVPPGTFDCQPGTPVAFDDSVAGVATVTFVFVRDEVAKATIVTSGGLEVARFIDGCFTVRMAGALRRFEWMAGKDSSTVQTTDWVRTLPRPYTLSGASSYSTTELTDWLNKARAVNCDPSLGGQDDILGIAFQYDEGSPTVTDSSGWTIASDPGYTLGSDFNDYLGISWKPPDRLTPRAPNPATLGTIDCSGFIRLVWGHRNNFAANTAYQAKIPLSYSPIAGNGAIPRLSREIYASSPGRVLVPFRSGSAPSYGTPSATDLAKLAAGDLVFFDSTNTVTTDPTSITHVGMVVGVDAGGRLRFISSREGSGPTMGDVNAWAVLTPSASSSYYPQRFRAARRI